MIEVGKGKYIFSMSFRRSSRLPQGVKNASAAPIKSVEFNWVKSRSSPNWVRLMRSMAYDPGLRDFDMRLLS